MWVKAVNNMHNDRSQLGDHGRPVLAVNLKLVADEIGVNVKIVT